MLLAFDVGNTDTKLGCFRETPAGTFDLVKTWRVQTARGRTADEYGMLVATLFPLAQLDVRDVRAIVVSSVVPQTDRALADGLRAYVGSEPAFFTAATQTMIDVSTERPKELGADLLAAAIAAKALHGAPAVVIGFGTATTFGAISREGEYLGAALAPGIRISIDALVERTAKLPQVALEVPNGPIGRDTVSALQAGIIYGFVGQTEALVARMRRAIGEDARVVATGGLADTIARHTSIIDVVEPHLVLSGLALWYASGPRP
jgi:type III pantothenate kinase